MEEKGDQYNKQLAHPKWKTFFDSVFVLGVILLVAKLLILGVNALFDTNIIIPDGLPKVLSNFLPLALMIIGGVGSDQLKNKYRN